MRAFLSTSTCSLENLFEGRADLFMVVPLDQVDAQAVFLRLLTNIMLYVMTDSFATGAWYYRGLVEEGGVAFQPGERVETPTAFANFPGEPLYSAPPRPFAAI